MRVRVLGNGVLAATTRECCRPHFDLVDIDPDILWVCAEPFHDKWTPAPLTIISSPVKVGTTAELQRCYPTCTFVVSPENVRYATAIDDFMGQSRIVVGGEYDERVEDLLAPFCQNLLWMSFESAEMVKHALNTYLALCVRFGNELGRLCKEVGADPDDVVEGLRSERRVAELAPLEPGPEPSDHLMREVKNMVLLGAGPVIRALV